MNEMGIDPIYLKMNLSKRMQQAKVCPYLLRNAVIDRPNQAWIPVFDRCDRLVQPLYRWLGRR